MHDQPTAIPYGYCQCGCGQRTKVPAKSDKRYGQTRGVPLRFVHNHHNRTRRKPFDSLVERGAAYECWEWTGSRAPSGYGMFSWKGIPAHRYAYEQAHGPIPSGKHVLHTCDNPPCVNPEHLRLGSRGENMRDMVRKGRAATTHSRLDADVVREIRARWQAGGTKQGELAAFYGVTIGTINNIVRRRTWADLH